MGVPLTEALDVGNLLGLKIVLTEFIAYSELQNIGANLSHRSLVISSYALCGFANFASIAIQIGGIGALIPERKKDLSQLGFRALIGGSLAAFMTATIAGMLV